MLLGDKDKVTKSTSPLVSYNSTHATDIVEPGGGPGGSDRLFEAKVVSPCTLAERQGAVTRGQKLASRRSGATYSASATPPSRQGRSASAPAAPPAPWVAPPPTVSRVSSVLRQRMAAPSSSGT